LNKGALHYSQTRISDIHSLGTEDAALYWSGRERGAVVPKGG
jgi:hypothetical protein